MEYSNKMDYLKLFDEIFKTNTKETAGNLVVIERIFDDLENDLYIPDEENRRKVLKIIDELEVDFTDRQRLLADELFTLEDERNRKHAKNLFMFGFIMGNELKREILETYYNRKFKRYGIACRVLHIEILT